MKIYMNIISSDALYTDYLTSIKEQYIYKVDLLLLLINNSISLVEQLNTSTFSSDLYQFKLKIIDLIK